MALVGVHLQAVERQQVGLVHEEDRFGGVADALLNFLSPGHRTPRLQHVTTSTSVQSASTKKAERVEMDPDAVQQAKRIDAPTPALTAFSLAFCYASDDPTT